MYKIGDWAWYAERETLQAQETCPECFGKKYLTVILGDDSRVTIDCAGCGSGYDPPKGYVNYWKQSAKARQVIISGIEISTEETRYKFDAAGCSCRTCDQADMFDSKEGAELRAAELADEYEKEQLARIHKKEKNNRTWSWHVHYYRKMIRQCTEDIERATLQLDAAKLKAKK